MSWAQLVTRMLSPGACSRGGVCSFSQRTRLPRENGQLSLELCPCRDRPLAAGVGAHHRVQTSGHADLPLLSGDPRLWPLRLSQRNAHTESRGSTPMWVQGGIWQHHELG